ncbi:MAG: DUF2023 family protein [Candidatus Gastranaerophilales bacterium]|nr:DUF2023 family protein [Candidatus Gastranaerophilales bacterium]
MKIQAINNYTANRQFYNNHSNKNSTNTFKAKTVITPEQLAEYSDLRVFHHHIYEYKKGLRNLILTTEKSKYREPIEDRLKNEQIDYVIHDIPKDKINVYFGEKACVDVVKTFNPKLNELSPEQDFILGIMLGYDRVKQCLRYLKFKDKTSNLTRTT